MNHFVWTQKAVNRISITIKQVSTLFI